MKIGMRWLLGATTTATCLLAALLPLSAGAVSAGDAAPVGQDSHPGQDRAASQIEREVLVERAKADGLADDPQLAAMVRADPDPDTVLAQAERNRLLLDATITQAQIAQRFAERPGDFDEFRLSHLFIAEQPDSGARAGHPLSQAQALARAQELRRRVDAGADCRRVDAGADFGQLASSDSDDAATAHEGGQLSSMFGLYLAKPFEAAVRALTPGQVSPPVRGPGGYHLIRLEEKHVATLDNVGAMIEAQLHEEARDRAIAQLVQARSARLDDAAASAHAAQPADNRDRQALQ
ncbi:peptidylprolyl isomerase [Xanthomonas arboricola]|uniref:peptidylprolyl isomerase n=1 Tax=Xanthomonas arboricola TaxID=56448 RepID=UPI002B32195A|nr:peptidylprolyl isomerase [Xanthomonas arboricola]